MDIYMGEGGELYYALLARLSTTIHGTVVLVSEFCVFLVSATFVDSLKFNREMRCEGLFHSQEASA